MRLTLLAAALLSSLSASAAPTVDVSLVHATHGTPTVDARLTSISKDLSNLPFERYELLRSDQSEGVVDEPHITDLGHGVVVSTTITAVHDSTIEMTVDVFRDKARLTHTSLRQPYGAATILGIGKEDGGLLVVPVQVRR